MASLWTSRTIWDLCLGPLIIATAGRPVRIKFTNRLPLTANGGDLFIPVDVTIMGAGMGPLDAMGAPCDPSMPGAMCANYTQNRATLHLHGGNTPWISDGTPHQWTVPAGETTPFKEGVSTQDVPDMPLPPDGSMTFYYPNQQSSRLMFYHDHAYGITRLNVYAGEAAGYLLIDPAGTGEYTLPIPGLVPTDLAHLVPLVIQDKTFVNDASTPPPAGFTGVPTSPTLTVDPLWTWGTGGNLWFPHVYMTNQDPTAFDGSNPLGRWDYGPWFWPVFPVADLLPAATSAVPEAFMDTPVVNGTAYPYIEVQPQAYRFRILNASNDRFLNLQLYQADTTIPIGPSGFPSEVKMVPAIPLTPPAAWPAYWGMPDARDGGWPDPTLAGPAMIQIGTEGGLLPAPALLLNTPIDYDYNRRSVTVLNVLEHTLFLGPAERGDVIIDFSQYAGKTIILYNDAPAPVPASDPCVDYYTGNPDYTLFGGAPSTLPGYGPNTRTIMQIRVAGTDSGIPGPTNAYNPATLTALQTALPTAFAATQPAPIVKPGVYSRISDTSLKIDGVPAPLGSIIVTAGGTGYTSPPAVGFIGGGGSGAAATATIAGGRVTGIVLTNPGSGYTYSPTVSLLGGGGRGAVAIANVLGAMPMQPKAIQELFDPLGRMNSTLGVELPFTSAFIQTTIPLMYIDPTTETLKDGETQLWKITHNGVDTHAIHFHLVNAQLVNRIGWDNAIKPPDDNELGWKDTIRMNPLEDIVVAVQAKSQTLPLKLPDSVRPLDVTMPLGTTLQFTGVDPNTGNPITVTNVMTNFGWEYVWHCHLLGHEENDMMRPFVMQVSPAAPSNLVATALANPRRVILTWVNNATNPAATSLTIQRATNAAFTTNLVTIPGILATATTFTDTTVALNTYYYRVRAENGKGYSAWSNTAAITVGPPAAPSNLTGSAVRIPGNNFQDRATLNWTDNANNETSFQIQRALTPAFIAPTTFTVGANVTTFSQNVSRTFNYYYRVRAVNAFGNSAWSNVVFVTTP